MNTQTIGRKSKELLTITILLNIAAIGWYGFLFAEIKAKNEQVSELMNQIEAEAGKESTLASEKALVAETVPLRDKLASYFVGKDGAVSFFEFLETTGNEVGVHVSIKSPSVSDLAELSQAEELRLMLVATGSWPAVVRFLGLLEMLPYEAHVEQVVVSKVESSGADAWQASLSLRVLKEK